MLEIQRRWDTATPILATVFVWPHRIFSQISCVRILIFAGVTLPLILEAAQLIEKVHLTSLELLLFAAEDDNANLAIGPLDLHDRIVHVKLHLLFL